VACIAPHPRLKEVEKAANFIALTADNFEVIAAELTKREPTYANGSPTTVIGPPTDGARVLREFWRDALGEEWLCAEAGTATAGGLRVCLPEGRPRGGRGAEMSARVRGGHGLVVVPGEAGHGVCQGQLGVLTECGGVVEGVNLVELTGVDDTHEEVVHRRSPRRLVGEGVMVINLAQILKYPLALDGKGLADTGKLAAPMSGTIAEGDFELFGDVAGEAIAHEQGLGQTGGAVFEDLAEVLAGMAQAGHEDHGPHAVGQAGDDAGGEDAGALGVLASLGDFALATGGSTLRVGRGSGR
jgi:hypothetical protein